MTIKEAIKNFLLGNPKKTVHIPIDPDSVKDNHQIKSFGI